MLVVQVWCLFLTRPSTSRTFARSRLGWTSGWVASQTFNLTSDTKFSSEVVHWINFQPKTLFKISLGTLCRLLPRLGKSILQGYQKRYWVFFNTSIVLKFKNLVLWQLQSTQDQNMFRNVQKVFKKVFVWNEKLKLDFSILYWCFCSKFKNNVIRDFTEIKVEVSTSFWRFCLCFRWEFLLSNTLWKLVIESGIKTEGSYRGVRL